MIENPELYFWELISLRKRMKITLCNIVGKVLLSLRAHLWASETES